MTHSSMLAQRTGQMPQSGIREIFDAAQSYDTLYDMSIGEPDISTPEPIAEAVRDALKSGVGNYTPTAGRRDLRNAIASKLARKNDIYVDPASEVLVTPGAMGGLFAATQVLCDPGDTVLLADPYWPNYAGHVASAGAEIESVPTHAETNFIPEPTQIESTLDSSTVGIILNTPTNPTGGVIPPGQLQDIGEVIKRNDLWAIADETYEDLVYDGATHHSLASDSALFDRMITIHTFSKSFALTGWRLGYASGPPEFIEHMQTVQEHTVSCAAEPSQVAALAALENQSITDDIHAMFAQRRHHILDRLSEIPGVDPGTPNGAFYIFADVSAVTDDSRQLTMELLKEEQVGTVPGSVFGSHGEGFLRFSYATDESTIGTAMDRFEHLIRAR